MPDQDERVYLLNRYICKYCISAPILAMKTGLGISTIYNYLKGARICRDAAIRLHRATAGELDYYKMCDDELRPGQELMLEMKPKLKQKDKKRYMPKMSSHV